MPDDKTAQNVIQVTAPATDEAKQWEGWGTALKPALEPITVARKPLEEKTVAKNVLKYGTGGINIDASRIPTNPDVDDSRLGGNGSWKTDKASSNVGNAPTKGDDVASSEQGRFPANLIHDGSEEVTELFPNSKGVISNGNAKIGEASKGAIPSLRRGNVTPYADNGSAARFFYVPKTSKKDHEGQKLGRFPANLIHDGSEEVAELFPESNSARVGNPNNPKRGTNHTATSYGQGDGKITHDFRDNGSAARFFYVPKTSKKDRNDGLENFTPKATASSEFRPNHAEKADNGEDGNPYGRWTPTQNNHPTVKPTDLMRYLVTMVTPKGGTTLDPFMGSGSTGRGAKLGGFNFIGIELDEKYLEIAKARIDGISAEATLDDFFN
jgi:hypothetical protein